MFGAKPTGFALGASATSFGASTGTPAGGIFGQTQQKQIPSLFGQVSISAGFGGNVSSGTTLKFNAPSSSDTMVKNGQTTHINTRHQCITAMKEYQTKSLEELRMEDYDANRKGKQPGSEGLFRTQPTATLQQSTGFNFGMTASPFGQQQQQLTSTGSTLFGAQPQSSAGALFGQANKPLFGPATTSTAGFGFGGSTGTGNSLFGNQNEPLFGSTQASTTQSSLFGSSGTTGFGAFGGGAGGFGTSTSTGGLFGTNRPAFGATPVTSTTGFGQTNRFNKPAGTGLFGATAQAPSFGTSTGSSLFGTKQVGFDITTSAPSFSLGATPGGLSGGNTAKPAGFGFGASTGFGGGFNTAQPSLNLGGASTMLSIAANQNSGPTPQRIQQQLLALNHSPYGDYPLLRNLIQESIEDIINIMSDLHDLDHNINSNIKEKEGTIIFDTGTEKKEDRRISDADRDVTLHGSSTDEDLIKDLNGPQGPTGEQGWPGDKGSSGSPGAHGRNGPQGPRGLQGERGTDGGSGSPGLPGVDGLAGAPGESRPVGRSGSPSISGMPGSKGGAGSEGPKGTQELQGARGDPGISEPQSAEGLAGTDGLLSINGEKGASGDPRAAEAPEYPGPRGPSGLIGSPCSLGDKGAPGQPGEAGFKGEHGPKGLHGSSGKRGPPGPSGNEGKQGQRGTIGEPGALGPPGERGQTGGYPGAFGEPSTTGRRGQPGALGEPGRQGSPGARGARLGEGSGVPGLDGMAFRPVPAGVTGNDERLGEMGALGICGPAGIQGPQGKTGSRGPPVQDGNLGGQGPRGPNGDSGPAGEGGNTGPPGATGEAGSRGPDRNPGAAGFVGTPGIQRGRGEPSKPGEPGPPGEAGKTGRIGANGKHGIPGVTGEPGAAGPVDGAGRDGEQGQRGDREEKGDEGPEGPVGPQGMRGPRGEHGPKGESGKPGLPGAKGGREFAGPKGEQVATGTAGLGEPIRHGATGFVHFVRSVMMLIMYHILTKTAKYCKDGMRYKFLIVPLLLVIFEKVIAPEVKTFLQTSVVGSVAVGKDFILNCACEGVCTGNRKWRGGPNDLELAYNGRVNKDMIDKINIIKDSSGEYSIKVLNATASDIFESNYTCRIVFATKQINRTELLQHMPTQPPTVASTPQQPKKSNTGEIVGKVIGVLLLVVLVVIVSALVIKEYGGCGLSFNVLSRDN